MATLERQLAYPKAPKRIAAKIKALERRLANRADNFPFPGRSGLGKLLPAVGQAADSDVILLCRIAAASPSPLGKNSEVEVAGPNCSSLYQPSLPEFNQGFATKAFSILRCDAP